MTVTALFPSAIKFRTLTDGGEIQNYASGTSYQGNIDISYAELVAVLGEPLAEHFDDYKCDAEWVVHFASGTVATIYNYKDGRNYMGLDGKDKEDIRDWHIGGATLASVKKVSALFPNHIAQ